MDTRSQLLRIFFSSVALLLAILAENEQIASCRYHQDRHHH